MRLLFRRTALLAFASLTLGFILAGCSHYRLGTGSQLAFQKLYVAPVNNVAAIPQARALVTTKIREKLMQDGRIALVNTPDEADATLEVVLKEYDRTPTIRLESDTGLARQFALDLTAEATLRLSGGRILFEKREVKASREAFIDGGQLQSEYQTVPLLADSLANGVSHAVLDTW